MKGIRPPMSRFRTEAEILAAIDRKVEFIDQLKRRSIDWGGKATILYDAIQDWPPSEKRSNSARDAAGMREKSDKLWARAQRIERNYLQRLKGKLATIRAGQLPALDNHDQSIPK